MANPGYVRSTDGSDADNGSTWALANATMAGAAADDAAGDTIYISQAHSEAPASVAVVFGTSASPSKLLCGNDAAEPPTALATGGTIAPSGTIDWDGSFYAYGLRLVTGGGGTSSTDLTIANGSGDYQRWEECVFHLNTTGASAEIIVGPTANVSECYWHNCSVKFGATAQNLKIQSCKFRWYGGDVESGSSAATNLLLLTSASEAADIVISGVDFTNLSASVNLIETGAVQAGTVVFRNCKLPASFSGTLIATAAVGLRAELWNCSATDTNYAMWVEDYSGSVKHETTLVRTGGASDGDTTISWKMASSANAEYPAIILRSPEIYVPNTTTGSAKTLTVEILHDSATNIQDDEIWLEVEYLGTSGVPLSLFADDAAADVLATPADQTDSSETWTTTGMSNPNTQKLSVSVTPQEEGVFICRVHMSKASYTVYVDPLVTVS